jgi:hypothetical protein
VKFTEFYFLKEKINLKKSLCPHNNLIIIIGKCEAMWSPKIPLLEFWPKNANYFWFRSSMPIPLGSVGESIRV